jgi:hypothetical protein
VLGEGGINIMYFHYCYYYYRYILFVCDIIVSVGGNKNIGETINEGAKE